MTATMRAAVYHGAKDVRIERRPVPTVGAGDVLVRVTRSGICGTDATEYVHGPGMFPVHRRHPASGHIGPMVMGHEFVGEVVDHGRGVDHLAGKRVATGAGVSCGECAWCRAGRTNLCARYWTLGLNADGGLAEFAVVPAGTCVPIPDDCPDDAAALAQPLAVGLHAVRRARVGTGETVVVIGAGAIGSFILCGLAQRGPARIIALDVAHDRLRTAAALGATETYDVADHDPVALVRDLTGGEGAPLVIESSGAPGSAHRAVRMAARGGRVLLVGLAHEPQSLDLADATLREVDLATTVAHVCGDDIPAALALLSGGDVAAHLTDRVIGLDALVPDGLDALVQHRAAGKILVDPWR
ncbi:MAG TPA: alcohol dehydrogenase catalytic domain-containing protein [Pseudonocardiaceae bacterium]|nr:alcohol dehydrogenase catalytic domain-containing protein [Pseudonocardiaceae bacterium]